MENIIVKFKRMIELMLSPKIQNTQDILRLSRKSVYGNTLYKCQLT